MALSPPPLDAASNVIPHDHPEIAADDGAIRRISDFFVVPDGQGQLRISSMAFEPSNVDGGVSIDLENQITDAEEDARRFVTTPRWVGSIILRVGDIRESALSVGFHPLPENPHHGEIWGIKSKATKRTLLKKSAWFVEIEGVSI